MFFYIFEQPCLHTWVGKLNKEQMEAYFGRFKNNGTDFITRYGYAHDVYITRFFFRPKGKSGLLLRLHVQKHLCL